MMKESSLSEVTDLLKERQKYISILNTKFKGPISSASGGISGNGRDTTTITYAPSEFELAMSPILGQFFPHPICFTGLLVNYEKEAREWIVEHICSIENKLKDKGVQVDFPHRK